MKNVHNYEKNCKFNFIHGNIVSFTKFNNDENSHTHLSFDSASFCFEICLLRLFPFSYIICSQRKKDKDQLIYLAIENDCLVWSRKKTLKTNVEETSRRVSFSFHQQISWHCICFDQLRRLIFVFFAHFTVEYFNISLSLSLAFCSTLHLKRDNYMNI